LRKLTDQALELLDTCAIAELLPPELSGGLMSLPQALHAAPSAAGYPTG
jgi:ATP-dependent DNA helicase RecG